MQSILTLMRKRKQNLYHLSRLEIEINLSIKNTLLLGLWNASVFILKNHLRASFK